VSSPSGPTSIEHDVVLCCPDGSQAEFCDTLESFLGRAGFRVAAATPAGGLGSDQRVTAVADAPDFVLFVTAASLEALRDTSGGSFREVAAALASGRNVVRVSFPGGPSSVPADLPAALHSLGGQQALVLDPDRLAESLSLIQHSLSSDTSVADRHVMRRWKRWFQFAAALVIVGFCLQALPQVVKWWRRPRPLPPVAPFTLYWTAFGERAANGTAAEIPVGPETAVAAGDCLRIAFSPSADGNAYVVAADARGHLTMLFPRESLKGASRVRAGQVYTAPVDTGWFTVDGEARLEKLYVFAGYDALQNLEELVEEPETPTNVGSRRELIDQTIAGLLDGRHYQYGRAVWIRTMQVVDQGLEPAPGPAAFAATSPTGRPMSHAASAQPGLVSTLVELTFSGLRKP
jgi:hypothetical protein